MENKKEIILKLFIAIGLFAIYAVPEYWKELFVSKTGNIGHPDMFFVLILVLGIYLDWKYLKQIVLIYSSIVLIILLFLFLTIPFNIQKPGFLILMPTVIVILLATYKLMKLNKIKITSH